MKEQRLDFPDYTADNQERDAERYAEKQKKDVYIVKVQGTYGAYLPRESLAFSVTSDNGDDLTKFWAKARKFFTEEMHIQPRFHCVINRGIDEYIKKQMAVNKLPDR